VSVSVSVSRSIVVAFLLVLTCSAATCDYRPDLPTLRNESGEPLEAHLFRDRGGRLEPTPISPEALIDQLQLAARDGCANYHVLELRRPGDPEVLVRHDFRQQPFCESESGRTAAAMGSSPSLSGRAAGESAASNNACRQLMAGGRPRWRQVIRMTPVRSALDL
jgi:hypothetical protein